MISRLEMGSTCALAGCSLPSPPKPNRRRRIATPYSAIAFLHHIGSRYASRGEPAPDLFGGRSRRSCEAAKADRVGGIRAADDCGRRRELQCGPCGLPHAFARRRRLARAVQRHGRDPSRSGRNADRGVLRRMSADQDGRAPASGQADRRCQVAQRVREDHHRGRSRSGGLQGRCGPLLRSHSRLAITC